MIRVRFAAQDAAPPWLVALDGVEVTTDRAVIALETEKNTPATREHVSGPLRDEYVRRWDAGVLALEMISIETQAGCNASCSFCPVSRHADPRPPGQLPWEFIEKVARELRVMGFSGRVALFGNNEPLMDPRLIDVVRLMRERVPRAELRLLTNGTLLTVSGARALFAAGLHQLTVNNYTDGAALIRPVSELLHAAGHFTHADVRISVRRRDELLTTRAGTAPNRPRPAEPPSGFCALPFTELYITYTGDVTLCCLDALGAVRLGNVADVGLDELWSSPAIEAHRRRLAIGDRASSPACQHCDFDGYRVLTPHGAAVARPSPQGQGAAA